jgi:hypothetical protein
VGDGFLHPMFIDLDRPAKMGNDRIRWLRKEKWVSRSFPPIVPEQKVTAENEPDTLAA